MTMFVLYKMRAIRSTQDQIRANWAGSLPGDDLNVPHMSMSLA